MGSPNKKKKNPKSTLFVEGKSSLRRRSVVFYLGFLVIYFGDLLIERQISIEKEDPPETTPGKDCGQLEMT